MTEDPKKNNKYKPLHYDDDDDDDLILEIAEKMPTQKKSDDKPAAPKQPKENIPQKPIQQKIENKQSDAPANDQLYKSDIVQIIHPQEKVIAKQRKIYNYQRLPNPNLQSPFQETPKASFKIKIIHTEGSRKGKVDIIDLMKLPDTILTIGRDPECILAYDPYIDQRVSALHSRLFCKNNEIFIEDLRSTNGTRVNGIKIFDVTRLRDGDEIELGRKGASFEIYKHTSENLLEDNNIQQKVAIKNLDADLNKLANQDPSKKFKDNTALSKLLLQNQSSEQTNKKVKSWLIFITAFLLLLFIGFVVLVVILVSELNETKKENLEYQRQSKDIKDDIDKIKESPTTIINELNIRDREEFLQLKKEFEDWKKQHKDEKENPSYQRFQRINQQSRDAIFLIVSQVELYDKKNNKKYLCRGSGTGFVVTPDGHLVTNKHVIKPWLFGKTAAKIQFQQLTVLHDTYNIFAWKTGSIAFTENKDLREDTAFSLGNSHLSIVNEGIESYKIESIENYGKFRVHESNSSDIAILKLIGSQHSYLKLYNENKELYWQPKQLDPILTIGFPEGIDFIEGTKVETSPSTGIIRKIENTIAIDAPIIKGNSGGPVIAINPDDNEAYVIGVATKVVKDTETMGLCIKASVVLSLLPESYR